MLFVGISGQRVDELQGENCCLREQVKNYMCQVENMLEDKKNYLVPPFVMK